MSDTAQPLSEAYDIKTVDFRNLLTVAVGTLSNQTGESFDSATLRGKCADEILRRYNETKAHAERLAEALKDILADSRSLEIRHYAETMLAAWEGVK